MAKTNRHPAAQLSAPSRCPHCMGIIWGKNPAYMKVMRYIRMNWSMSKRATRAKEIMDVCTVPPGNFADVMQRLLDLELIHKPKRGYYEPT